LCEDKINIYVVRQIQETLIDAGYNLGPAGADNVFGEATKEALLEYQQHNYLPHGNLNIETLEALGIEY